MTTERPEHEPIQVLSYGGGIQTIALLVLCARGVLPTPDRIVFADTGREVASTFAYLDQHARPVAAALGREIEIATSDQRRVDLYGHNGDLLLPAFTTTGKLQSFCSTEWKARVVERHLRATGVTGAVSWIGFSLDERHRVKGTGRPPWYRRYPLLELGLTRTDCERVIQAAGLPLPSKSRCWMCPHQSNAEWREVRDEWPAEWRQAVALDAEIRAADERGGVFLHASRRPLAEADLETPDRREPGRQCGLGACWV